MFSVLLFSVLLNEVIRMRDDVFDKELLEISSAVKGGYGFFINNAGKAIALITLAVSVLIIFADVGFADLKSAAFTTTLAVMLISSYIIYFSLEDSGERYGERCDEYKEALLKYKTARAAIGTGSIKELRSFCLRYSKEELSFRRANYIAEAGYTEEEYENYKNGGRVSLRERYYFSKARRMRAVRLTPSLLLSGSSFSASSELEDPGRKKYIKALVNLLPSTVCMVLTVSIILNVRGDLTPSVVLDGLIKLSALPVIGFRGYTAGYSFVKDKKSVWLETKARLLSAFTEEQKEKLTSD